MKTSFVLEDTSIVWVTLTNFVFFDGMSLSSSDSIICLLLTTCVTP
ncbi:hypothetical protein MtrunA17_Chr6g0460481 [Medicago truncatula]|uniref:Uncharacterized protein n=1 Tax=Medicago truncatula TaxID=3880 RepID=A0A396HBL5_MEDTR|nr:hypothetical protein MtrunA17_Chr6g0460481 [Medicago truncatula]